MSIKFSNKKKAKPKWKVSLKILMFYFFIILLDSPPQFLPLQFVPGGATYVV